jgi:hypothetical protein
MHQEIGRIAIARTQFGQIMDLAVKNNERFIVDRRGEPSVVIMSVQDFIRTAAPPPDWLIKAWAGAKRRGLDTLTLFHHAGGGMPCGMVCARAHRPEFFSRHSSPPVSENVVIGSFSVPREP